MKDTTWKTPTDAMIESLRRAGHMELAATVANDIKRLILSHIESKCDEYGCRSIDLSVEIEPQEQHSSYRFRIVSVDVILCGRVRRFLEEPELNIREKQFKSDITICAKAAAYQIIKILHERMFMSPSERKALFSPKALTTPDRRDGWRK